MKHKDTVDIYNDLSKCIAEDVPIEAFSPAYNPYIQKILDLFKRTAFINLPKLQNCIRDGKAGWETAMGQDECQMPWYGKDLPIMDHADEIANGIRDKIKIREEDEEDMVQLTEDTIVVKMPKKVMDISASRDPVYTWVMVSLAQTLSEVFGIDPIKDLNTTNMIKAVIFGRYPQSTTFPPGAPVSSFLRPSNTIDGLGCSYSGVTVNHLVALSNKRTMDGLALATILEQASQWEMGNSIGWYERYCLLGYAYEGYNANSMVLDLVKENRSGNVADVVYDVVKKALNDGVIKVKNKAASGYRFYATNDFPKYNAYELAGTAAGVILNCGAMRAGQAASAIIAYIHDLFMYETGGLPDTDAGRLQGAGIGFAFYTHSIYGGAGPGAYSFDHVILRGSGFIQPLIVAGMCLDSGTQLFSPEMTSGAFFKIRERFPIFQDVLQKVGESAEEIKNDLKGSAEEIKNNLIKG